MPFRWEIHVDKDERGRWRAVPSGHYRFGLRFYSGEGDLVEFLDVRGFRVTREFNMIIPPTSTSAKGSLYHHVCISPEGMQVLMETLKLMWAEAHKSREGVVRSVP